MKSLNPIENLDRFKFLNLSKERRTKKLFAWFVTTVIMRLKTRSFSVIFVEYAFIRIAMAFLLYQIKNGDATNARLLGLIEEEPLCATFVDEEEVQCDLLVFYRTIQIWETFVFNMNPIIVKNLTNQSFWKIDQINRQRFQNPLVDIISKCKNLSLYFQMNSNI